MDSGTHHINYIFDLPQDILDLIFCHLPPKSFLALCAVYKEVYDRYRLDPLYWRVRTSSTFRLPISPLLHADGARWAWLYKKLRTQTRPFSWGRATEGGLGPSVGRRNPQNQFKPSGVFPRVESSWPTEVYVREDTGIIVDLQCGGWYTAILTNDGKLFAVGIIDASFNQQTGKPVEHFTRLQLFAQHSISGIRQFSAGRCHVLGLDDNGYIWSWDRTNRPGCLLSFQNSLEHARQSSRVVAGWAESSAYIPGNGIMYWPAISTRLDPDQAALNHDLTINELFIPATGYHRGRSAAAPNSSNDTEEQLSEGVVGEVLIHVMLEGYIVFITHLSKMFAYHIGSETGDESTALQPLEVPGYSREGRIFRDLQGSFRSFAVFTANKEVLAGDTEYLDRVFAEASHHARRGQRANPPYSENLLASRPADIPALQNTGVIAVGFGDYHSHALHANGTITAYGTEPSCCGALGLGSTSAGARFRGVKTSRNPINRDGWLLPVAKRRGRQVWFEHEKCEWLSWMESWIRTPTAFPHFPEVFAVLNEQEDKQAAFSEWVEQEGRQWCEGPMTLRTPEVDSMAEVATMRRLTDATEKANDSLPAYFAISIAAAGHHSGALVLVDDDKAEKTRQKWIGGDETGKIKNEYVWENNPFPRIKLPDGYEFPGEGQLAPWCEGMPTAEQLGLEGADIQDVSV